MTYPLTFHPVYDSTSNAHCANFRGATPVETGFHFPLIDPVVPVRNSYGIYPDPARPPRRRVLRVGEHG